MVKISVITPVYQVEPYLRRCVDSILHQDFTDIELILVDDGSPDGCGAICDEYAAQDARVRVIHQENTGQATARNRAAAVSEGQFITFVDGDDVIAPGYLTALYEAAERDGADITVARICLVTERRGDEPIRRFYPLPAREQMDRDQALEALGLEFVSGISCLLCGKLIRRQLVLDHPFPEGRLFEDSFAIWRQFMDSERVVCVPKAQYDYLQRSGSSQRKPFEPRHLDLVDAVRDMMAVFEAEHMPPAVLNAGAVKTCRSCYVTAYHATDLPYRQFCDASDQCLPLLRQYLPAARATGRMKPQALLMCWLLMHCRPVFYAAARVHQ